MKKCWCGNIKLTEYSEDYCKCDLCHTLIYKNDFKASIYDVQNEEIDLYGKNYWESYMAKGAGKDSISEVIDMYLTERVPYWLNYILRYVRLGACIAEIGCGLGQLQYVLRRLDYKQVAYELSHSICAFIEKNLNINIYCGEFNEDYGVYDAILAFDLFEHLVSPLDFMDKCSKSLKEGGVLCFQTPCYNYKLNYNDMKKFNGRFARQLKAGQHIYLYSRESITQILKKYGFKYIVFEPAFFGDDYDMFLFASKTEIIENTKDEIDAYLNSVENGRLVKAVLNIFEKKEELNAKYEIADKDREERAKQINILTSQLKESEEDRSARAEQIEELTHLLKESEEDRTARGEQVEILTRQLKESEEDRSARAEQIEKLTRQLKESEEDRSARAEQIEKLTRQLKESEEDRSARWEQISTLTRMINEKNGNA